MPMLKLSLTQEELTALLNVCMVELRTPIDQIRFILREDLHRRGLLNLQGPLPSDFGQPGDQEIPVGQ